MITNFSNYRFTRLSKSKNCSFNLDDSIKEITADDITGDIDGDIFLRLVKIFLGGSEQLTYKERLLDEESCYLIVTKEDTDPGLDSFTLNVIPDGKYQAAAVRFLKKNEIC